MTAVDGAAGQQRPAAAGGAAPDAGIEVPRTAARPGRILGGDVAAALAARQRDEGDVLVADLGAADGDDQDVERAAHRVDLAHQGADALTVGVGGGETVGQETHGLQLRRRYRQHRAGAGQFHGAVVGADVAPCGLDHLGLIGRGLLAPGVFDRAVDHAHEAEDEQHADAQGAEDFKQCDT
jgi:hypothetical protein